MRFRSTAILLIVVAALGSFILLVERKGQTTRERELQARRLLQVEADRVSFLRFEAEDFLVECVREGDDWMIVQPVRARASQAAIARILAGLENLAKGGVITGEERRARGLDLHHYGLDEPRAMVTYGDSMHRRTILVGRDALLGDQLYIMGQQQDEIVITSAGLVDLLPVSVAALRDRALFHVGPERVQRLELGGPDGFLQLVRQDRGRWMIQQPVVSRAAAPAVTALLDSLYNLRVAEFVSDTGDDSVAYGFDDPALQITAWYGERYGEASLLIGQVLKSDPALVYAKIRGQDSIYALSTNILGRLRVGLGDLRDKRLTPLSRQEVVRVQIENGDRRLVLQQQMDGAWDVTEPRHCKAEDQYVRDLLSAWVETPVLSFVDGVGTNLAAHGFHSPEQTLIFARGARDVGSVRIRIGSRQKESDRVLVRVEGEDALCEIDSSALDMLSTDPLFFRDREVLSVSQDDITFITVQDGERRQSVERDASGTFRPVGEDQFVLNDEAIKTILMVVGEMRAIEFVADDPDDLAPFGLEQPVAVFTIGLRGEAGISRSVLFGDDAAETEVYAMIRGRDLIFVLGKVVQSVLLQTLYAVPPPAAQEPLEADLQ